MTAQAYNSLDGDSLGADKIIRATTMQSLYDNPTAIAQRGSGAPWNNGIGAIAVLTSGSGNWTVPDGVYRIKVTAVGGGGGGGSETSTGTAGGNTTFSTLTANGGGGGVLSTGTRAGGAGGTATGGDINIAGQSGAEGRAGAFFPERGAPGAGCIMGSGGLGTDGNGGAASGYGAGGSGSASTGAVEGAGSGGAGGVCIKIFTTTPGGTLAYAVGAAGAGATSGTPDGGNGAAGVIIIEY